MLYLTWTTIYDFPCLKSGAMSLVEAIGPRGGRSFVLCKKEIQPQVTEDRVGMMAEKAVSNGGSWKA